MNITKYAQYIPLLKELFDLGVFIAWNVHTLIIL